MASRRINSRYRIDFSGTLEEVSSNLDRHYRKKSFELSAKANQVGVDSYKTASGLGRVEQVGALKSVEIPWNRVSGASRDSIVTRTTQDRKTGYLADAFRFTTYHDMQIFKRIASSYYGENKYKDYIIFLQAKYGTEYLSDIGIARARAFYRNIEGIWGRE